MILRNMQSTLWRTVLLGCLLGVQIFSMVALGQRNGNCSEGSHSDEQVVKYDRGLTVRVTNMDAMELFTLIEAEVNKQMDVKLRITTDSPIDEVVSVDLNRASIIRGLRKITTSLSSGTYDGKLVTKAPPGESKRMRIFEIHKLDETDIAKRYADIETEMQKGHDFFEKGAFRDAAYHFSKAKQYDPSFIDGEWHVGKTFLKEGDFAGAIEKFTEKIRHNPEDPEPYFDLAMAHTHTYRYDLMIDNMHKSLSLTTDERRKGEIERTIAKFDTDREKEYFKLMIRGRSFFIQKKYDEAISTYKDIVRTFPEKEEPYQMLTTIFSSVKRDFKTAGEYATVLLSMDNDNPRYMFLMSQVYVSDGKVDSAIDILRSAQKMDLGIDAMKMIQERLKSLEARKNRE